MSNCSRPLALDLYCGAGGVSYGLRKAGFRVIGIDLEKQPNYRFPFIRADIKNIDFRSFDFIWASPPCQHHTDLKHAPNAKAHEDLIPLTREKLIASGCPYVIENVEGAPLNNPIVLCGSQFGMGVWSGQNHYQLRRHRLFECNFPVEQPECNHYAPVIGIYGGHVRCRSARHGGRQTRDFIDQNKPGLAKEAMGIDWMTMNEMSQAIPPSFSKYIGEFARDYILKQIDA